MFEVKVTPEHQWLSRLVGTWTWENEPVPGMQHHAMKGTETWRAIGDIWMQGDATGDHGATQMTLGFDSTKGRFVGTWLGAMMNYLWVYDGERHGERLDLYGTGPSMAGDGTHIRYRDEVELLPNGERLLRGNFQNPDGSWTHFMTTRYRRV